MVNNIRLLIMPCYVLDVIELSQCTCWNVRGAFPITGVLFPIPSIHPPPPPSQPSLSGYEEFAFKHIIKGRNIVFLYSPVNASANRWCTGHRTTEIMRY